MFAIASLCFPNLQTKATSTSEPLPDVQYTRKSWFDYSNKIDWVRQQRRVCVIASLSFHNMQTKGASVAVYICQMYEIPDALMERHGLINHMRWIG